MATLFILPVPVGPSSSVLFLKEFLDRLIPLIRTERTVQALSGTSPSSPESTRRYRSQKFGENLELVERKLTELAETFEPMELVDSAMDIYMRIRPKVPEGKAGWGKEGSSTSTRSTSELRTCRN